MPLDPSLALEASCPRLSLLSIDNTKVLVVATLKVKKIFIILMQRRQVGSGA
jgi:hypothetical protein